MLQKIKLPLVFIFIAVSVSGLTYWFAPSKIKIEKVEVEKTVEVEKVVYREREKENRRTTTERTTKPDGTITEKVTEELVREETTEAVEEARSEVSSETRVSKEVVRVKPSLHLYGGLLLEDPLNPTYFIGVQKRLFANIYVGAQIDTRRTVGLTVGITF